MGGRAAEELIFGNDKVTSGAMSDIRQVTALASAMVKEWGMSDKVGPVYHGHDSNPYMKEISSEEVNKVVETEIKILITEALTRAKKILVDHSKELEILAQALLKYETLSGDEIRDILEGKVIEKDILFSKNDENGFTVVKEEPKSSFK